MKVFVSLPDEILGEDLTKFWNHLYDKMTQEYKGSVITSNYTGNGSIEDSDMVIFLYEFRNTKSCKRDKRRCDERNIPYNFFTKYYAPERIYYPSPTQE